MVNQKILLGLKQAFRFTVLVGLLSNANFSMAEPGFIGKLTNYCSNPDRTVAAKYEKDFALISGCVGCHSPTDKNKGRTPLYTAYKNGYLSRICPINVPPPPSNMPPTANANGPYSESVGLAVKFSSAGSTDPDGTIMGYSWEFGDGNSSAGPNPSHTYTTANTFYTVSLTVTDNDGATNTATTRADIKSTTVSPPDADNDGIADTTDNCPMTANPDQLDTDNDGVGNMCDNCQADFNPDELDSDNNGKGDACEVDPPVDTRRMELIPDALSIENQNNSVTGKIKVMPGEMPPTWATTFPEDSSVVYEGEKDGYWICEVSVPSTAGKYEGNFEVMTENGMTDGQIVKMSVVPTKDKFVVVIKSDEYDDGLKKQTVEAVLKKIKKNGEKKSMKGRKGNASLFDTIKGTVVAKTIMGKGGKIRFSWMTQQTNENPMMVITRGVAYELVQNSRGDGGRDDDDDDRDDD